MDDDKPWLAPVGVGGVWLMRDGDHVLVLVERDGTYYEAIREHHETNFSHCISAEGIRGLETPVPWMHRDQGDTSANWH